MLSVQLTKSRRIRICSDFFSEFVLVIASQFEGPRARSGQFNGIANINVLKLKVPRFKFYTRLRCTVQPKKER